MLEHVDTNSFAKSQSPKGHDTSILENRRPPGKATNLRAMRRLWPLKTRDPVNFGEAGRRFHSSGISWLEGLVEYNDRSSRKGKEKTKTKTSEGGTRQLRSERDFRVGDSPRN